MYQDYLDIMGLTVNENEVPRPPPAPTPNPSPSVIDLVDKDNEDQAKVDSNHAAANIGGDKRSVAIDKRATTAHWLRG